MKMITAILSSIFIFISVWLIIGIMLLWIWPYSSTIITAGKFQANIASIIGLIFGCLAGSHTFKASLHSRTGRIYKKEKEILKEKKE